MQRRHHHNERKKKWAIPVGVGPGSKRGNGKQERTEEASRRLRKEQTFVSDRRTTWKEKTSPQRREFYKQLYCL